MEAIRTSNNHFGATKSNENPGEQLVQNKQGMTSRWRNRELSHYYAKFLKANITTLEKWENNRKEEEWQRRRKGRRTGWAEWIIIFIISRDLWLRRQCVKAKSKGEEAWLDKNTQFRSGLRKKEADVDQWQMRGCCQQKMWSSTESDDESLPEGVDQTIGKVLPPELKNGY